MTLYAIFDPKPGTRELPAIVPQDFSWFACILPPAFFASHGLWLELVAWLLKVVALIVLSAFIGGDASCALYLLAAIWIGFAAAGFRRHALAWRGWTYRGNRVAPSADMAQLEAIR